MKEVIEGAAALKDVGIAVIIIVGFLVIAFRLIDKYPDWKKAENESKDKRAEVYANAITDSSEKQASALRESAEKQANALERMSANTSEALEHLGERTELLGRLVEKVIDTLERHHQETLQHTSECRNCARNVEFLAREAK